MFLCSIVFKEYSIFSISFLAIEQMILPYQSHLWYEQYQRKQHLWHERALANTPVYSLFITNLYVFVFNQSIIFILFSAIIFLIFSYSVIWIRCWIIRTTLTFIWILWIFKTFRMLLWLFFFLFIFLLGFPLRHKRDNSARALSSSGPEDTYSVISACLCENCGSLSLLCSVFI